MSATRKPRSRARGTTPSSRRSGARARWIAGKPHALGAYGAERRPIAQQVVALADRLTRLASVPPVVRGLGNLLLRALAMLPPVRRNLAWRLSGLVYR